MSEKEVTGRFSVSRDDPGREAYVQLGHHVVAWRTMLNGKEVRQVVTVDTTVGEILVNELDRDGKVFIRDGDIAQKILRGNVQVFVEEQ